MRGQSDPQDLIFFSFNIEERIPENHPLREVKRRADAILRSMNSVFEKAYSKNGRPSIPPEQLLKALLLQALYSIPSEIKLMEAIEYSFLYRWFLGMQLDAKAWTPETFSMNRKRFEEHQIVRKFFDRVVASALTEQCASTDHFTVDGTLVRSWASQKSLVPRDKSDKDDDTPGGSEGKTCLGRNPYVNFRGEKRTNKTHYSRTDPEALIYKKGGTGAYLSHSAHVLMENRNGLIVDLELDRADGHAERRAARTMISRSRARHRKLKLKTIGFDSGYDCGKFLDQIEKKNRVVPHVAIKNNRKTTIPSRQKAVQRMTTKGYAISQRIRKRVEEIFGWAKTVGRMARTRFVGRWKIAQEQLITGAAYNLLRLARLKTT